MAYAPRPPRPTPEQAFAALQRVQRRTRMIDIAFTAASKMVAQEAQWGPADHADGTNEDGDMDRALDARLYTDSQRRLLGDVTWRALLEEEVAKAVASRSPEELRERLVDVMGLAGSWILRLDERATR